MGMIRKPKFRRGDLVKVIHAFDHELRPSSDADALLQGDLLAYVCDHCDADDGTDPSYKLEFHGEGQTARCLPSGPSLDDPDIVLPDRHHAGSTSSWWSERCLALVAGRPVGTVA